MAFGTTYTYNASIPAANNYPGNDQPNMLSNTANIALWAENDHVGFNSENGGTHEQISQAGVQTLLTFNPTGSQSVVYPVLGTAGTSPQVQEVLENAQCIVPLSAIRAFGCFDTLSPAPVTFPSNQGCHNSFNVTGNLVTYINATTVTIQIATGAINSGGALTGTPCVLLNYNTVVGSGTTTQPILIWTWTAPGTLQITNLTVLGKTISFVLLQF